jgi:hypothetical protein
MMVQAINHHLASRCVSLLVGEWSVVGCLLIHHRRCRARTRSSKESNGEQATSYISESDYSSSNNSSGGSSGRGRKAQTSGSGS